MYTLSSAMAARLFVVCFDLGAQAERVRAWGWGQVLACDLEPRPSTTIGGRRGGPPAGAAPPVPRPANYSSVLRSYYEFTPDELDRFGKGITWEATPRSPSSRRAEKR